MTKTQIQAQLEDLRIRMMNAVESRNADEVTLASAQVSGSCVIAYMLGEIACQLDDLNSLIKQRDFPEQ